jgi:hypothetical protein
MKLKGAVVDRMREVLGGRTPTERRVEKLLEEVETLRAKPFMLGANPDGSVSMTDPSGKEWLSKDAGVTWTLVAPPDGNPVVSVEVKTPQDERLMPPGPGEDDEDEDEGPVVETIPKTEREIMMAAIQNLEAKVAELSKPRTAEDREQAIGAGRLPTVITPAAPIGYTGSAQLPRGEWFETPALFRTAPKILMMICGCPDCTPFRLQHYFCVTCHKGPLDYQQKNPAGRKIWLAPGATWGITHESCSVVCYMRYMELMGVVSGINEHVAPAVASDGVPAKPALLPGSD